MALSEMTHIKLMGAGLNMIQQALSIFDSDLRLSVSNRRYQTMFELPDHLVTPGVAFEDTIRYLVTRGEYGPVEDTEDAVRVRVDAARAFVPHYMERQRANGRWISVEGAPLPQGGWVTVYTDITEVKLQERLLQARSEELSHEVLAHAERLAQTNRALAASNAALEQAKRELTEMEARTRLTTEMMPAHIAHMDRELRYTFSNRRLSSIFPGLPQDIVGLPARDALGPLFNKIRPWLDRALAGENSVHEFTHDASGRRIRLALTPDHVSNGPISGVYVLSMDVTEEAQARAALAQTRKRELAAQLSSGLAHDFGNLLTIILGLQGQLARRADLPPEALQQVQSTISAARRGGVLLERIATISGHRELHPLPTNLAALFDDMLLMARPALPATIGLGVTLDTGLPPLMLDQGAVQDSLLNLILNARDAIGGAPGEIALRARRVSNTWLELQVQDTGTGFSPEALEKGLDPFFTTKGHDGSGLGLAMVYDQITLSGGTVQLSNRREGGGQVTLRLPFKPAPVVPAKHNATAGTLVLLVEDTDTIRETVRAMLRDLGHSVIEAASHDEALSLIDLPGLGMVLSDINLAGPGSGLDLLRQCRTRGLQRLHLMTALPSSDTLRSAAEREFPVLAKPFTLPDLRLALEHAT